MAGIGAVLAFLVHNAVAGHALIPTNDIWGIGAALAAIFVAVGRLQF